jgi:hypothetical protein
VVEVTPQEIRAQWVDRPVGPLTGAAVARDMAAAIEFLKPRDPAAAEWTPRIPGHSAGGGLGLYVYQGTASFRNVVVEPLPGAR